MAGGDVRVGRRAVSSDTARGVPRKRNVSGGCGGSWMEARVAVVVVIWYMRTRAQSAAMARPKVPCALRFCGYPPLRTPLSISIRLSAPRYRLHGRSKSAGGRVVRRRRL